MVVTECAVRVERVGKQYRLGEAGAASVREVANRWANRLWTLARGTAPVPNERSDFWALRHVSFEVAAGEVVGIIGHNGAGKSTLLKLLSRIMRPTEGRMELRGRVASLLEVGTGFHPELTGRENVYLNAAVLGMTRGEVRRRFDEIVAFAGVERHIDTPIKRYSSGMTVRLGFAVAAHLDPEILIVDEVLAVGDAEFQQKCIGKMSEVSRSGRTVLFVSHQMPAIRSLCRRVVVLKRGGVEYDGAVEEGLRAYLTRGSDVLQPRVELESREAVRGTVAELQANGATAGVVQFADELSIVVDFAAESPIRYPAVGFVIFDAQGEPVLNANNTYQRMDALTNAASAGRVTCRLGAVPLMPGQYSISLWMGDGNSAGHVAEHALRFEVQAKDVWGKAKLPPRDCSMLWWPTQFECQAAVTAETDCLATTN